MGWDVLGCWKGRGCSCGHFLARCTPASAGDGRPAMSLSTISAQPLLAPETSPSPRSASPPQLPQTQGRKAGGADSLRQWGPPEMTQSRPSWRAWHAGGWRQRPSRTSARRPPAPRQSCLPPLRLPGRVIAKAGTSCAIYRQRGAQREKEAGCGGARATPVPPECGSVCCPSWSAPSASAFLPPPTQSEGGQVGPDAELSWGPFSQGRP